MFWDKLGLAALVVQATDYLGFSYPPSTRPTESTCEDLTLTALPGLNILNYSTEIRDDYSSDASPPSSTSICKVSIIYSHEQEDDVVRVHVWLPLTWNGRFLATGGGGLAAGNGDAALALAVARGYSTGTSDGGLTLNGTINPQTGAWALREDNSFNIPLLLNFRTRAIHDMTVMGKALSRAFYGTDPSYSYYAGCSTGGRQGYFAAEFDPTLFDGILAAAPAVNMPELAPALFWPTVVMENVVTPKQCIFEAYANAVIDYCDPLDGAVDGLVSRPEMCDFDVLSLVGTEVNCGNDKLVVQSEHAEVVHQIWSGPATVAGDHLWLGLAKSASFSGVADTIIVNGTVLPAPFVPASAWILYFIFQDPKYDATNMTFGDFETAWNLSLAKQSAMFSSQAPNLSKFQKAGGKLLTWHGMADELINYENTAMYRTALARNMSLTDDELDDFYRVFFAPGVHHCIGGAGPAPEDSTQALVDWVESGFAPETLFASKTLPSGKTLSRNLCRYPMVLEYDGTGDVDLASSFSCT